MATATAAVPFSEVREVRESLNKVDLSISRASVACFESMNKVFAEHGQRDLVADAEVDMILDKLFRIEKTLSRVQKDVRRITGVLDD